MPASESRGRPWPASSTNMPHRLRRCRAATRRARPYAAQATRPGGRRLHLRRGRSRSTGRQAMAVGSASFTVDNVGGAPAAAGGGAAACASLSGTYQRPPSCRWTCTYVTVDGSGSPDPELVAACAGDGIECTTTNHGDGTYTKAWTCPTRAGRRPGRRAGAYGGSFDRCRGLGCWAVLVTSPGEGSAALRRHAAAACTARWAGATRSRPQGTAAPSSSATAG